MSDFLQSKELDFYVSAPICYGIVQTGEPQEEGVPAIEVKDIVDGKINEETIKKTTVAIDSEYKRSRLKTGDMVIAIRGTIGRVAIVPSSLNGANITRDVARIRVDDPDKRDYIYFYLTSKVAEDHLRDNNIGQAVKGINIKDLKKLPIFIPEDKNEIKKLNNIFKTASKQIEKQKHLIEAKEIQKKGLMQKLLSGEVRFSGFSDVWEEVRLEEICDIKKGEQLNKDTLENDGEFPVINGGIEPSGFTDEWNTEANTITISEGGNSCGYVNFLQNKFWSGGHCYTLLNLQIDKIFLYQFLKYNQHNIMKLRVGSGLPNIQKSTIEKFTVSKPSFAEQQKIAEVLSLADDEINLLKNELEELKQQKKALMQKLLTGQVRVKV